MLRCQPQDEPDGSRVGPAVIHPVEGRDICLRNVRAIGATGSCTQDVKDMGHGVPDQAATSFMVSANEEDFLVPGVVSWVGLQ